MKLSIVIPCYNESRNIPLILDRFSEVLENDDVEVILVDNGSTDDTEKVLLDLLPRYPFARTVRVDVNQGYGFGILRGLREARGEFMGWTHADMQTDPGDTVKALQLIENAPNPRGSFAKGNRRGRPVSDVFFTFGMGLFESAYLGVRLRDINAQPNVFHRGFFESWEDPPHDFSLDLYVFALARKQGLDVIRFPVRFPKRIHGHSKWNLNWRSRWKFILRTLEYSAGLKRRFKGRAD